MYSRWLIFKVLETSLKGGDTSDTNASDMVSQLSPDAIVRVGAPEREFPGMSVPHRGMRRGCSVPNGTISGVR